MRNTLILYKGYDSDLLGLLEQVGLREWGHLLKESLRILIRPGYTPKHTAPQKVNPYTKEETKIMLNICITGKNDEDIVELLNHVKQKKFGSFCKMALRFYIGRNNTLESMLDISLIPEILIPIYQSQYLIGNFISPVSAKKRTTRRKPRKTKKEVKTVKNIDIDSVEIKDITDIPVNKTLENSVVIEDNEILIQNASYDTEKPLLTNTSNPDIPIINDSIDYYSNNNENNIEFDNSNSDDEEDDILSLLEGMM